MANQVIGELHARECRLVLKLRFGRLDNASARALIGSRKAELSFEIKHINTRAMGHTEIKTSCLPILQANDPSNTIHNALRISGARSQPYWCRVSERWQNRIIRDPLESASSHFLSHPPAHPCLHDQRLVQSVISERLYDARNSAHEFT